MITQNCALLKKTLSAVALSLAFQSSFALAMENVNQESNVQEELVSVWNKTPNEVLAKFCLYPNDNTLLSLRIVDMNTSQIVDDEFRRRAAIKTPLACLTILDAAHPTPHTMSYFVRKRLWEIPILIYKVTEEAPASWLPLCMDVLFRINEKYGATYMQCKNFCKEWSYHGEGIMDYAERIIKNSTNGNLNHATKSVSEILSELLVNSFINKIMKIDSNDDQELMLWYLSSSLGVKSLPTKGIMTAFSLSAKKLIVSDKDNIAIYYSNIAGYTIAQRGDSVTAKKIYKIAADQGNSDALLKLGDISMVFDGDHEQMRVYYEKSANHGNSIAQYNLSKLYLAEGNLEQGNRLLKMSADQGYACAQYTLGQSFNENGDMEQAKKYYKGAADQRNDDAQYELAQIYEKTGDTEQAKIYYEMAGGLNSYLKLAALYFQEGDRELAKHYYGVCGHSYENAQGQYNLGVILMEEGNVKKAIKYHTRAAKQGHVDALYNLGLIFYQRGEFPNAEDCWKLAANQGHPEAQQKLKTIFNI